MNDSGTSHPPRPKPRNRTTLPFSSTTSLPCAWSERSPDDTPASEMLDSSCPPPSALPAWPKDAPADPAFPPVIEPAAPEPAEPELVAALGATGPSEHPKPTKRSSKASSEIDSLMDVLGTRNVRQLTS